MIRWKGTTYSLHPLLIMLLALSAITGHLLELLTLVVIVAVHEAGHVIAAKCFGWSIVDVKLLPFGGVAETEDGALSPSWQEIIVAAAGPLQNVLMIGLSLWFQYMGWWSEAWSTYFIEANLIIGGFNLLPIPPLDGGRILQALCAYGLSYHFTLRLGAWIGIVGSALLGLFALLPLLEQSAVNMNLLVLGLFLLWTNIMECRHVPYRFFRFLVHRAKRLRAWEMSSHIGRPIVASSERGLVDIMQHFRRNSYHMIYVIDEHGRIQRVIPEQQLIDAFFQHWQDDS
ncbi:M50 family metallopeptidase [Paenibacillus arenosi]|uniref:M50 family metallopeptidase n=1 Tax=Paenibacillus arenosi TaxID=2774142 RepID=A0ABR9B337_9BACL|nr:M50 family metallopeptidase [Paenibacillus arenosi]MBD8500777.1 M50 family metallopeptidase [Paenibacillus arenosi]